MSQARKLRRAAVQRPRENDGTPPMGRVGMVAGISLGLSDEQATDALNALAGFRPTDATAGALFARMLELVDLARREGLDDTLPPDLNTAAERAKLDRSFGAGFVKRVTSVGQPAASMLGALRSLLLLLAILLWSTTGTAAPSSGALAQRAHKIQRRNRRYFGRRGERHYHNAPRTWTRWSRKYAGSRRRFTSSPSSEIGCGRGLETCKKAGKSSRSYWFGVADSSTWGGCPRVIPTSRSNVATARSRALHTAKAEAFAK